MSGRWLRARGGSQGGWFASLAGRITLAVAIGALVLVAFTGALYAWVMQDEVRTATGRQLQTTVARVADDLEDRITQRARVLQAISSELALMQRLPDARQGADFLLAQGTLATFFDRVMLIDAQGMVVADRPRLASRERRNLSQTDCRNRPLMRPVTAAS
jgi:hypothetical protein